MPGRDQLPDLGPLDALCPHGLPRLAGAALACMPRTARSTGGEAVKRNNPCSRDEVCRVTPPGGRRSRQASRSRARLTRNAGYSGPEYLMAQAQLGRSACISAVDGWKAIFRQLKSTGQMSRWQTAKLLVGFAVGPGRLLQWQPEPSPARGHMGTALCTTVQPLAPARAKRRSFRVLPRWLICRCTPGGFVAADLPGFFLLRVGIGANSRGLERCPGLIGHI